VLLGIAMGRFGMSRTDFCRCTPSQFQEVAKAYRDKSDNEYRNTWEQVRILGQCTLQPYAKKVLRPTDVLKFPWDKEQKKNKKFDAKEEKERYEKVKKLWGIS